MGRAPLKSLSQTRWDVVIVGAGAVGCATARELAGRGYKTLLLDRGDIGAGTSSRSSRMLYSGLGYLAVRYPLWLSGAHTSNQSTTLPALAYFYAALLAQFGAALDSTPR